MMKVCFGSDGVSLGARRNSEMLALRFLAEFGLNHAESYSDMFFEVL